MSRPYDLDNTQWKPDNYSNPKDEHILKQKSTFCDEKIELNLCLSCLANFLMTCSKIKTSYLLYLDDDVSVWWQYIWWWYKVLNQVYRYLSTHIYRFSFKEAVVFP